jgi:acyl-coenzyme A thioesterase PaaI-like protein
MMSAASMATASTQREPSVEAAVSIRSIAISYIGAARNVGVRAYAKVVRRGRDAAHVTVHVDSETGDVVAIGNLSVAIHDADVCASSRTDSGGLRRASLFTRLAAEKNEPVLGSPFLEESGLAALEEQVDDWQSLLLPVAPNEDRDRRIDDGAVVGLIDNCGSMAAYTSESVNREMLGTTISLAAVFATPTPGPVIGSGRLLTQLGTALTSEVEIWSPDDGSVRAAGSVCYRIPGAGTV